MSRQEILATLIRIFSTITDATEITESCDLLNDLGISSMDLLSLVAYIEEEFQISISERSIRNICSVGDLVDVVSQSLEAARHRQKKTGFSLFHKGRRT